MAYEFEGQRRRAAQYFGLRPTNGPACPRILAGKSCLSYSGRYSNDSDCPCQRYRKLLDHGRIWFDKNGRNILTGEPYYAHGREIAEFVAEMTELGLSVSFPGQSMWNAHTLTIMVIEARYGGGATERPAPAPSRTWWRWWRRLVHRS